MQGFSEAIRSDNLKKGNKGGSLEDCTNDLSRRSQVLLRAYVLHQKCFTNHILIQHEDQNNIHRNTTPITVYYSNKDKQVNSIPLKTETEKSPYLRNSSGGVTCAGKRWRLLCICCAQLGRIKVSGFCIWKLSQKRLYF